MGFKASSRARIGGVGEIVTHFSDPFYLDEDIPRKKSQIKYDKNEIPLINHWKKGLKTFLLGTTFD